MHRSYQPLKPATNRYLQHRWDQEDYDNHRRKVSRHWCEGQPDLNPQRVNECTHLCGFHRCRWAPPCRWWTTRGWRHLLTFSSNSKSCRSVIDRWRSYFFSICHKHLRRWPMFAECLYISRRAQDARWAAVTHRQGQPSPGLQTGGHCSLQGAGGPPQPVPAEEVRSSLQTSWSALPESTNCTG